MVSCAEVEPAKRRHGTSWLPHPGPEEELPEGMLHASTGPSTLSSKGREDEVRSEPAPFADILGDRHHAY
jgi:hypothetical protein